MMAVTLVAALLVPEAGRTLVLAASAEGCAAAEEAITTQLYPKAISGQTVSETEQASESVPFEGLAGPGAETSGDGSVTESSGNGEATDPEPDAAPEQSPAQSDAAPEESPANPDAAPDENPANPDAAPDENPAETETPVPEPSSPETLTEEASGQTSSSETPSPASAEQEPLEQEPLPAPDAAGLPAGEIVPETDTEDAFAQENELAGESRTAEEAQSGEALPDAVLEEEADAEPTFPGKEEKTAGDAEPVFPVEGGWYRLVPKTASNMVLGTVDGAMLNGTAIIPAQYMRLEHQIFRFDKGENGGWILTNGASEKVAALEKSGSGAALRIYARGKARSEFRVTCLKNGSITLRSEEGRYVKYYSGKIQTGNKKRTETAEFTLVPATNVPDLSFSGTFFLRTLSRIRLVAGISKSSKANGARVLLSNYSDAAAQRFSFLYSSDGYYRIVGEKSRKVLTVYPDGTVAQTSWTSANTQRWRPVAAQGSFYLVNADGNVLTVEGDYVKKGVKLSAEARNSQKNQIFLILRRGSAEAKKNLVKKPVTIFEGVDYKDVYSYDDYMDRYTNLANVYGTDCAGALRYFVENGMSEGQRGSKDFDVWCYRRVNPKVRKKLLADIPAYYLHYIQEGKAKGLRATGEYQTTQAPSLHDLAWKAYNEVGAFSSRPNGQEMCEYLNRAAQVEFEAYGFPKSIVIAMAIKECGFLTFNDGLPPSTNNVLTMNVSMWNALWKSGWLGDYVSVRVPQYDSILGKIVFGYEPVRSYEDIEACMDDFANFKTSMVGPIPEDMSIDEIIDTYLEGYATSPTYRESIKAIIKLHQLKRFDR